MSVRDEYFLVCVNEYYYWDQAGDESKEGYVFYIVLVFIVFVEICTRCYNGGN